MKTRILTLAAILVLIALLPAAAQVMVPHPWPPPPEVKRLETLTLKSQKVDVTIDDQIVTTKVELVFHNNFARDLEGTFLFPLPAEASVSEFALWMGNQRITGEVMEKDRARTIYEGIVRQMRDPGLLEYAGRNLFSARIYPVPANGDKKVELTYKEALPYNDGTYRYVYPLNTKAFAGMPIGSLSINVALKTRTPLTNIYTPFQTVAIKRDGDQRARISYEASGVSRDQDFELLYSVSSDEVGLSLLSYRKGSEDGYFLLLISPTFASADRAMPKDIILVLDKSGSMAGNKIVQARKALEYCVDQLSAEDRFNLVTFDTDVTPLWEDLRSASRSNLTQARKWIANQSAQGSTNIDGALKLALSQFERSERPQILLFVTDGLPTAGTTDVEAILRNAKSERRKNVRVFTFGVGDDVNTHLLDRLSGDAGGVTEYVRPSESIDFKVGALYNKLKAPVLTDLDLDIDGARVSSLYPRELPDLFAGGQITLVGRYDRGGSATITLKGRCSGKTETVSTKATFVRGNTRYDYVPRLWATRRIGDLLDNIRLHGENGENVAEVTQLGKEFGIVTPYTSYLVTENASMTDIPVQTAPPPRPGLWERTKSAASDLIERLSGGTSAAPAREADEKKDAYASAPASGGADSNNGLRGFARQESGAEAVHEAQALAKMKSQDKAEESSLARAAGGHRFILQNGGWVDTADRTGLRVFKLKAYSDGWFRLSRASSDWAEILGLGDRVTVVVEGIVLEIGDDGSESIPDGTWASLTK